MRIVLILMMACAATVRTDAQTQEMEQLKLNLEKLAQFKLMLTEMKSGYQTLLNGYNALRDAGRANFSLHKEYLDGLLTVSSSVASQPAVQRIYAEQKRLLSDGKTWIARLKGAQAFKVSEINEIVTSYTTMVALVDADTELLLRVLAPGLFRMSDGERSGFISAIESSVQRQVQKFAMLQEQYNRQLSLRIQTKRDAQDIRRLGKQ